MQVKEQGLRTVSGGTDGTGWDPQLRIRPNYFTLVHRLIHTRSDSQSWTLTAIFVMLFAARRIYKKHGVVGGSEPLFKSADKKNWSSMPILNPAANLAWEDLRQCCRQVFVMFPAEYEVKYIGLKSIICCYIPWPMWKTGSYILTVVVKRNGESGNCR